MSPCTPPGAPALAPDQKLPSPRTADPQRTLGLFGFASLIIAALCVVVILVVFLGLPSATCRPTCGQPGSSFPPSPVEGVVIAVDSRGLGQVAGFTLRTATTQTIDLKLGALENASEFSPGHLAEHMASSQQVRAYYRLENGMPMVYRLEDVTP